MPSPIATVFALPIFLGAFLVFQVQPLLGRYILPWFGGTASVWTTALLFFQLFLLLGYLYAHLIARWLGPRAQASIHLLLLAASLTFLPVAPDPAWKPGPEDAPVGRILQLLAVNVGLPYVLLASTGPLLQSWFSRLNPGWSPYRMYALSNVASLLALASYPFVIEPALTLGRQVVVWSVLYGAFVLAAGWSALRVFVESRRLPPSGLDAQHAEGESPEDSTTGVHRPRASAVMLWLLLPAAASAMLLSTTNQLTQEVAGFPFLWVLPLSLYLVTFVICFDRDAWYDRRVFVPMLGAFTFLGVGVLIAGSGVSLWMQLVTYCGVLFACCMTAHGELVRLKPEPRHLTLFYLMIAAGGALGGAFVAVVAPALFSGYWEFHVALIGCCGLVFISASRAAPAGLSWQVLVRGYAVGGALLVVATGVAFVAGAPPPPDDGNSLQLLDALRPYARYLGLGAVGVVGVIVGAALDWARAKQSKSPVWYRDVLRALLLVLGLALASHTSAERAAVLRSERSFYGVLKVAEEYDRGRGAYRKLTHGTILHGAQFMSDTARLLPTTYYGPLSGVGLALLNHPRRAASPDHESSLRVGIVGLGVGTVAAYGLRGDVFRFYEINPGVVRFSDDYFTYRSDTHAEVQIVVGDARVRLEEELARGAPQRFDVLAVDAFSSGSIPIHLLTEEGIAVYLRHLAEDGVLALHISNRFVNLRPVARALARRFGLRIALFRSDGDTEFGMSGADWVIMASPENPIFTAQPLVDAVDEWPGEWIPIAEAARRLERPPSAIEEEVEAGRIAAKADNGRVGRVETDPSPVLWTDSFSSLWSLLAW